MINEIEEIRQRIVALKRRSDRAAVDELIEAEDELIEALQALNIDTLFEG